MAFLAPRIGNEVSYVTQIIDDIHFAWQAHYLVRLLSLQPHQILRLARKMNVIDDLRHI